MRIREPVVKFTSSEMIGAGYDAAARTLCKHAFTSILKDYTDVIHDNLGGLLLQVEALGFRMHDLAREGDPEHKGTLLYREQGDKLTAIAFIGLVTSLKTGGIAIKINRLDKDRMDILELRETTIWN